jgi:hypothetical protein
MKAEDDSPKIKIELIAVPSGINSPLHPVKVIEVDGKKFLSVEDVRKMVSKTSCVIDLSRLFSSLVQERKHDMGSMLMRVVEHAIKLATGETAKTPFDVTNMSDIALLKLTMASVADVAHEPEPDPDAPCDCPTCVQRREAEKASNSRRN